MENEPIDIGAVLVVLTFTAAVIGVVYLYLTVVS